MGRNRSYLRSDRTDVYRVYDADGDLLYVGISSRLIVRLSEHRQLSAWFSSAMYVLVEAYATQLDARHIEATAIRDERPLHNIRPEAINARAIGTGSPSPLDSYVVTVFDIWGDFNAS